MKITVLAFLTIVLVGCAAQTAYYPPGNSPSDQMLKVGQTLINADMGYPSR